MKPSEHRRGLLLAVGVACCLCAACVTPRDIYYAATHQMVEVPSANMEPTIKPGDRAAVDVNHYKSRPVERFDMVTYKLSREHVSDTMAEMDLETFYLSRVVGLGGETLEVKGGRVYINGLVLDEPFTTTPLEAGDKFGPVKIPEGEFFMMGDNRPNSLDSRYWARPTLKKQSIFGKVVEIFPQSNGAVTPTPTTR